MSLDQDIRYRERVAGDPINEEGLYSFIMPSRILVLAADPLPSEGQAYFYAINAQSGAFWFKNEGGIWIRLPFTFGTPAGGGITNLANDGVGAPIFKSVVTNTAHLRTLTGTSGKVVLTVLANEINFGINIDKNDVQLGNVLNIKSVFNQSIRPSVTQDSTQGFVVGSFWQFTGNPAQSELYICQSNVINNAIWTLVGPQSAVLPLTNVGGGQHVYIDATSGPAQLRTLESTNGRVTIANTGNTLNFGVNLTKNDVGLNNVTNIKNNYAALTNPGVNDDTTQGYLVGSTWNNVVGPFPALTHWICTNAATGAAQWFLLSPLDFCFALKPPFTAQTSFAAYNTPVTLKIGPNPYLLSPIRGSWVGTDSGTGFPINIVYTPTHINPGGNNYQITYDWFGNVANPVSAESAYILTMNIGNGSSPSTGAINGSAAEIDLSPPARFTSTSVTFMYHTTNPGPNNFFMAVFASNGVGSPPPDLFTTKLSITFTEI